MLVWPMITNEGRAACMKEYGFADVLAIEDVVKELLAWPSKDWADFVERRRRGLQGPFDLLDGK
jgi:hypothetical protein